MSKQICAEAGKVAGQIVRTTAAAKQKACERIATVGRSIGPVIKSVENSTKDLCAKLDDICKLIKKKRQLSDLRAMQKNIFQKIGQEVFSSSDSGRKDILENLEAKELLKQADACEKKIQKLKVEIPLPNTAGNQKKTGKISRRAKKKVVVAVEPAATEKQKKTTGGQI